MRKKLDTIILRLKLESYLKKKKKITLAVDINIIKKHTVLI